MRFSGCRATVAVRSISASGRPGVGAESRPRDSDAGGELRLVLSLFGGYTYMDLPGIRDAGHFGASTSETGHDFPGSPLPSSRPGASFSETHGALSPPVGHPVQGE